MYYQDEPMSSSDDPQCFVRLLASVARCADASRRNSILNDPETGFWTWVNRLVARFYYASTARQSGILKDDFLQDCKMRIIEMLDNPPEWLLEESSINARLAGYIMNMARNLMVDLNRKKRPQVVSLDQINCDEDDTLWRTEILEDELTRVDELYDFQAEVEWTRRAMPEFLDFLDNKPKTQATLTAVLYFGERLEDLEAGVSRYWFAYKILTRENKYSPEELRDYLQETFPEDKPENISSRLTLLKQEMREFLRDHPGMGDVA